MPSKNVVGLALIWTLAAGAASAAQAAPLKGQLYVLPDQEYRLLVKFSAAASPRLSESGALTLLTPTSKTARPLPSGMAFRRTIAFTPEELGRLENGATANVRAESKFDILEFAGLMYLESAGADKDRLLETARALEARDDVEYCELEPVNPAPPPLDIAPPTPDYTSRQGYLGPDPGIDCKYAWSLGIKGQNVRVSDVEFDWNPDHEDLMDQDLDFGMPKKPSQYSNHGTAVQGIMMGGHNGYGVDGCVPQAVSRVYSELHGRATAITRAAADSKPGDVILLEMQTNGPDGKLAPPDVSQSVWDAVQKASAAGIIVVSAAGNGGADLDAASYAAYRGRGDNGMILEGAGSPNTRHDKLGFSTFGARVNVQGWGQSVFSLDYGNIKAGGSDVNQFYTSSFSGTSSAGPIVTSAVVAVQSYAKTKLNKTLTPREMRDLLMSTGTPQGTGGHIGPLPNIRAAITALGPVSVVPAGPAAYSARLESDGTLALEFPGSGSWEVELRDLSGRALYAAKAGAGAHRLRPAALHPGIYYLSLRGGGVSETRRLALLR